MRVAEILECLLVESDVRLRDLQRRIAQGDTSPNTRAAFRRELIRADKGAKRAAQVADRAYQKLRSALIREFPDQIPSSIASHTALLREWRVALVKYVKDLYVRRSHLIEKLDSIYEDSISRAEPVDAARDMVRPIDRFFAYADLAFRDLRVALLDAWEDFSADDVDSAEFGISELARSGLPIVARNDRGLRRVRPLAKALRNLNNHFGAEYSPESVKLLTRALRLVHLFAGTLEGIAVEVAPWGMPHQEAAEQIYDSWAAVKRSVARQRVAYSDLTDIRNDMSHIITGVAQAVDEYEQVPYRTIGQGLSYGDVKDLHDILKDYNATIKSLVKVAGKRGGRL